MVIELLLSLLRAVLGLSLGLAAVLALRPLWMRLFGAPATRALWGVVPLATMLALVSPALPDQHADRLPLPVLSVEVPAWVPLDVRPPHEAGSAPNGAAAVAETDTGPAPWAWLLGVWAVGAIAFAAHLVHGQRRAIRQLGPLRRRHGAVFLSPSAEAAPLAYGLLQPRVVLPGDFRYRYSASQRALVLAHERSHIRAGDLPLLALAAALRSLFWFHPLVHIALPRLRFDLEAACDARVLARNPRAHADYARALLNTQLADSGLPVGCAWRSGHPLLKRIQIMRNRTPNPARQWLGAGLSCSLAVGIGSVAWAAAAAELRPASVLASAVAVAAPASPAEAPAAANAAPAAAPTAAAAAAAPRPQLASSAPRAAPRPQATPAPAAPATATPTPVYAAAAGAEAAAPALAVAAAAPDAPPAAAERMHSPARVRAVLQAPAPTAPALPRPYSNSTIAPPTPVLEFSADQRPHAPNARRVRPSSSAEPAEISLPVLVEAVAPEQPRRRSFAGRRGGEVLLEVDLDADGQVLDSRVASDPLGAAYALEARRAVKSWRFKPALLDGRPVSSTALVPVRFNPSPQWDERLHQDASPRLLGPSRPGSGASSAIERNAGLRRGG